MCGIAGIFSLNQPYPAAWIQSMTGALAHRGPDAGGFFTDGHVSFGHRRLGIIDLSEAANQPMQSHDERWVAMFNGEIFNYKELCRSLNASLRTQSDTEVMLELFAAHGVEALTQFNGMFSIALYDVSSHKLFLCRDRLGVKPLFYYPQEGAIFFASEIKALLALDHVKHKLTLNESAMAQYLHLGYIAEPYTIWNEIKRLPAGSYLESDGRQHKLVSYWKPEEQVAHDTITDFATAKSRLNDLLTASVTSRMICDVPFGVFLSGGIDSSLVAAIAQRQYASPVKTFTVGFAGTAHDESEHARAIAAYLKTDHHEFTLYERDALEWCERGAGIYDEPFADSSFIPTLLVAERARREVKMVLSGDGGDELFMGYGMYRWARRLQQPILKMFRKPIAATLSMMGHREQRAAQLFRYQHESTLPSHIFSQEQYLFSQQEVNRLLKRKTAWQHPLYPDCGGRQLSVAEKQALYDLKYYLKDDLLVKVDRATMHFALECRMPFLDYRLVEFALNVDERLKMKNGELKWLPKQLLADYLPPKLFERPKQGFSIPLQRWLLHELRHLIDEDLARPQIEQFGFVSYDEVDSLKKKFFNGSSYLYNRLWSLIVLHRWLRKNL